MNDDALTDRRRLFGLAYRMGCATSSSTRCASVKAPGWWKPSPHRAGALPPVALGDFDAEPDSDEPLVGIGSRPPPARNSIRAACRVGVGRSAGAARSLWVAR